jgi:hypothetical protein
MRCRAARRGVRRRGVKRNRPSPNYGDRRRTVQDDSEPEGGAHAPAIARFGYRGTRPHVCERSHGMRTGDNRPFRGHFEHFLSIPLNRDI